MIVVDSIFSVHKEFIKAEINSENELFELVSNAEIELNDLVPEFQLGIICRRLMRMPVTGKLDFSKSMLWTFFSLLKSSTSKASIVSSQSKVLLIQNSLKYHFRSLIEPLVGQIERETDIAVVSEKTLNGTKVDDWIGDWTPFMVFSTLFFALRNSKTIQKRLSELGFIIPRNKIIQELFIQLSMYRGLFNWLKRGQYELIVVDTDRGNFFSTLVCAASQKLNIRTVSLQHGVVDMGFGYYPVIADQIWCWGNFSKKRFSVFGVDESRIKMVGNPTAKFKTKNNDKMSYTIGFGFSGHHPEKEQIMVENLLAFEPLSRFKVMLKLRPSVAAKPWMIEHPRLQIYKTVSQLNANELFFQEIDILITTVSSIGPETVMSGVPIWIYRLTNNSERFDNLLIETGHFPDISSDEILRKETKTLVQEGKIYLNQLLEKQTGYLMTEYFEATGKSATQNIVKLINTEL
ncbi:MAG: hypothetical protein ACI9Z3_001768 [Roseivirga sp.]|jgi:hypothetical protein